MAVEIEKKSFENLSLQEKAKFIIKERIPSPEDVIYPLTVEFLDPDCELTREQRLKVVTMGDRTAISYRNLKEKVIKEDPELTKQFFESYALSTKSSKQIPHSSILEQVNVGPTEKGGDSPITIEGISILSGLRDICSLRHFGFEAFSSRGGIFPDNYWRIPGELMNTNIGQELESINKEIYEIYLYLTEKGVEHYLQTLQKGEGEKDWQYRWRVLSSTLDNSRQVTNGTFLNHLSMHPNSALSVRNAVVKLTSSMYPETVKVANKLLELSKVGLPTVMKYTEASDFEYGLFEKKARLSQELGMVTDMSRYDKPGKSRIIDAKLSHDANKIFLASFIANKGTGGMDEVFEKVKNLTSEEIDKKIGEVFDGIGLHDVPPKELEMIHVTFIGEMSLGAIYEAMRHRLVTHLVTRPTPFRGFTVPEIYKMLGL